MNRLISRRPAWRSSSLAACLCLAAFMHAAAADRFDAAVAHEGRSAADVKRDALDHPAEILRLTGIKPGMHVADVLAGDGYYSELLSYLVGPAGGSTGAAKGAPSGAPTGAPKGAPKGQVLSINNAAFDGWSDGDRQARLAGHRLPNVRHETVDLNDMHLAANTLDAVLLIKVYHDLYWVDTSGKWPKIDTNAVLTQLTNALKPGGVLLVVDHSAKTGSGAADASALHRIDEAYAIKDFESHGLKMAAKSDLLRRPDDARDQISYKGPMLGKTDRFVLVFRKPV